MLSDKYEIVRQIGGSGNVYEARDTALKSSRVLKVLPMGRAQDLQRTDTILRELTAVSTQHDTIVTIFGVACQNGRYYLVEDFVQGGDLRAYIARRGPLPAADVISISREVADALAYAHRHGIAHLGLTARSVLIDDQRASRPRLTDFGLTAAADTRDQTQSAGSASSISRANRAGGRVVPDAGPDIYALGMLMLQMCEGSSLAGDKATGQGEQKSPAPIPERLLAIIARAVGQTPSEPYRRVDDLLRDLELCGDSTAEPDHGATIVLPSPRRRSVLAEEVREPEYDDRTRVLLPGRPASADNQARPAAQRIQPASGAAQIEPERPRDQVPPSALDATLIPKALGEARNVDAPPPDRQARPPSLHHLGEPKERVASADQRSMEYEWSPPAAPDMPQRGVAAPTGSGRRAATWRPYVAVLILIGGITAAAMYMRRSSREVRDDERIASAPSANRVETPLEIDREWLAPRRPPGPSSEGVRPERRPLFASATPAGERVSLRAGTSQEFAVFSDEASAGGERTYTWERNGQVAYSGSRPSWTLYEAKAEDREVRVTVATNEGERESRTWTVNVASVPRISQAPRIVSERPARGKLLVDEESRVAFRVQAEATGESNALAYAWFFDRREVARTADWQLAVPPVTAAVTRHTVEVEVSDAIGLKAPRVTWTLEVRPVRPTILDFAPRANTVPIAAGQSRLFSVVVEAKGGQRGLLYEWAIDSGLKQMRLEPRFLFPASLPMGIHDLTAVVVDGKGRRSAPHRWTVEISGMRSPLHR